MDEATLGRRLAALTPPDLDGARGRAQAAARAGLGRRSRTAATAGPRPSLRLALTVGLLAILAAAITPAGQAAVSWVGERVGIGEPGGPPTLETLRRAWDTGTTAEGAPAYVLAEGPGPHGGHYELVTYVSKDGDARCFEFDMTKERNSFSAGCEPLPGAGGRVLGEPLPATDGLQATIGGNSDPDQAFSYVSGRVSEDVENVRVELDGRPVETELVSIPAALIAELGIATPFKLFVAFPEDAGRAGEVDVTAEDSSGTAVAHKSLQAFTPLDLQKALEGAEASRRR